jgi:methylenetetrahydrofolate dehydrogenase (NADP+)/methenyltetrahydrofolate cyclohydrolase
MPALILVGEDPASQVCVRNRVTTCVKAGFRSITQTYPADVKPVVAQAQTAELNADPSVHGILVQRPRCRSTLMPQP